MGPGGRLMMASLSSQSKFVLTRDSDLHEPCNGFPGPAVPSTERLPVTCLLWVISGHFKTSHSKPPLRSERGIVTAYWKGAIDVRFGSEADMCSAQADVRFPRAETHALQKSQGNLIHRTHAIC